MSDMPRALREVSLGFRRQRKELKVSFPGGSIGITTGLYDTEGQSVTVIGISADGETLRGDPQWWAHWGPTDARGGGVRLIQHPHYAVGVGLCEICGHYGEDCTGEPKPVEPEDCA